MADYEFDFSLDDIINEVKGMGSAEERPSYREPVAAPRRSESIRTPEPRRSESVREPQPVRHRAEPGPRSERSAPRTERFDTPAAKAEKPARKAKSEPKVKSRPAPRFREKPEREPVDYASRLRHLKAVPVAAFALMLVWALVNVHPGAVMPSPVVETPAAVVQTPAPQTEELSSPGTEGGSDIAQPEATPEVQKPVYTIAEGSVIVPRANPANFGSVNVANAAELAPVIEQARQSGLIGPDEKMVFDPTLEFNSASYYKDIMYYLDDTILAICWKQIVDGNTVTCMEVKVADASQFRRKITGDSYGSPTDYLSNLSKSTNAVVAMNADFYQFRDYGVMVYDGEVYKCTDKPYMSLNGVDYRWYNCLDNLFITKNGDFIFRYAGEQYSWDELQQYVNDNEVSFSISFGPILVDNYEVMDHYTGWYPVGETEQGYSRAGIGQVDERHYLYMSLNHSDEKAARWTMLEFGQFFQSRGVRCAYALDGGQTSEIIFNNEIYNHIDKSSERWVSDMIYFGTAIPEEVWNNG